MTSAAFRAATRGSHSMVTVADLWYGGRRVAADLPIVDGKVTIDDDADIRTTAQITIADPYGTLVPMPGDMNRLSVYGHEIHLRQGIPAYPGAPPDLVDLGWLRVQSVSSTEQWRQDHTGAWVSAGATLEVECLDRMSIVDDARFLSIEQPPASSYCLPELRRLTAGLLAYAKWPTITDVRIPAAVVYDDSRTNAVKAIAGAAGVKAYLNRQGLLQIRPLTVATTADMVFTGLPDGGLLGITEAAGRDGVYNAVVARGEATDDRAPVQGAAYDTDPSSPTRWDGPYKRVPAFYSSPLLTTAAQATAAAQTRLRDYLTGRDQLIEATIVPDPSLEPGVHVVALSTPRRTYTGRLVLVEIPLTPTAAGRITIRAATAPTRDEP